MNSKRTISFIIILLAGLIHSCTQVYEPPAVQVKTNFLVVEGIINSGQDSTIITLSRTKSITDTSFTTIPELNANVFIEEEGGSSYPLSPLGTGQYGTAAVILNSNKRYRLRIQAAGNFYSSAYVPVKQTPPIASLSWAQPDA